METTKEKIVEILAEGGLLICYRNFIGYEKDKSPNYLFSWGTNEIGLEDDIGFSANSNLTMENFPKFWKKIEKKYPLIYDLHPAYVHSDYQIEIAKKIREKIDKGEEIYNIDKWAKALDVPKFELINKDYFDYDLILNYLNKFKEKIGITNFNWNQLQYRHSDYKTIDEFRSVFNGTKNLNDNIAGLYAYFLDECIYIGKSKNIKYRLENHWKSSQRIDNPKRGEKHRILFEKYKDDLLSVYYLKIDDKFNSRIGEELRKILENILHLKYKPEFEKIKTLHNTSYR